MDIEILSGGLMNAPTKIGDVVHRVRTPATETIHRLLRHVRSKGIRWVPEPLGLTDTHESLSYLPGTVPHDMPDWIWAESVLERVASRQREWHDATVDFDPKDTTWGLETSTPSEVVCHNDFAPYNCVFRDGEMVGLIDFDLCAPGSRLWDMAYTAYRYIPVMPSGTDPRFPERSPFDTMETLRRLDRFLDAYAQGTSAMRYSPRDLLRTMSLRLEAIAEWTRRFGRETSNPALSKNADMYEHHARWIESLTDLR